MKAEKIRSRLKASYVLIPKLITPTIDSGEQIEAEIYLAVPVRLQQISFRSQSLQNIL
jgi:hypothetical protein